MAQRKNAKKKRVVIVFDVRGDHNFIYDTIDRLLDDGAIQVLIDDSIEATYEGDGEMPKIWNALVEFQS